MTLFNMQGSSENKASNGMCKGSRDSLRDGAVLAVRTRSMQRAKKVKDGGLVELIIET